MQRRDFCKLVTMAAAYGALPGYGQGRKHFELPSGFNEYTEDYAHFCALRPEERTFYAPSSNKIVPVKLDNATWKATAWGSPEALPISGGSWDGVPMDSPIDGLAGTEPYKPVWDSLLQYEAPEWYRDAKFGIWAHWSPQCVPEAGDWYARNMYIEGSPQYKYHLEHYGPPSRFGYKDLCPQWTLLDWAPDDLIARYKKAGARIFIALANHHDGFDTVSLMPADNVDGFRPDTILLLRQLHSGFWRLPGGNFLSDWSWYNGIGPRDKRPPTYDYA